jgi:hypothetical protein
LRCLSGLWLPCTSKWAEDANIAWLQCMCHMWQKTDNDDMVLSCKFNELIGTVWVVSIENQKMIHMWCLWSGIQLEVPLQPFKTEFLVCPSLWRYRNARWTGI